MKGIFIWQVILLTPGYQMSMLSASVDIFVCHFAMIACLIASHRATLRIQWRAHRRRTPVRGPPYRLSCAQSPDSWAGPSDKWEPPLACDLRATCERGDGHLTKLTPATEAACAFGLASSRWVWETGSLPSPLSR